MECGVCTGSCPISRELSDFSPRQMLKRSMMETEEALLKGREIWACLSCARCSTRCPVEIDFPGFIRSCRQKARTAGNLPAESHHGMLQTIAAIQTNNVKQQRTDWAKDVGTFGETGDYFYFVGCLPYFDVTFQYLNVPAIEIGKSVLKLLNKMGITPVISNDERCCGHDALWSGDEETFRKLAELNMETIRSSGAKTVIFSCPEGYYTFKHHYLKIFGDLPFELIHMTEFLARELPGAGLSFAPSSSGAVTFQDPCRLGRLLGIYEEPRKALLSIPGMKLVEMGRNRDNALCCGTSAWMECSGCSKTMQIERLNEAVQTGANTLVTACPKCQIHLTCAKSGTDIEIAVKDLYAVLLENLGKKEA